MVERPQRLSRTTQRDLSELIRRGENDTLDETQRTEPESPYLKPFAGKPESDVNPGTLGTFVEQSWDYGGQDWIDRVPRKEWDAVNVHGVTIKTGCVTRLEPFFGQKQNLTATPWNFEVAGGGVGGGVVI